MAATAAVLGGAVAAAAIVQCAHTCTAAPLASPQPQLEADAAPPSSIPCEQDVVAPPVGGGASLVELQQRLADAEAGRVRAEKRELPVRHFSQRDRMARVMIRCRCLAEWPLLGMI